MKPGTRVRLLVAAPDLRQNIRVGEHGTVEGPVFGKDDEGWLWVQFDSQDVGMSMRPNEIEEIPDERQGN